MPDWLLERVSVEQLVEMMAYERLEPFGGAAEDYRAGTVAATIANVNRAEDASPYSAEDFMPALRQPKRLLGEGMDADQLSALLDATLFGKVH
jgi:hypothetical protein